MKSFIITIVTLFTFSNFHAQLAIEVGAKGSYNSTWLVNKNISDLGESQDYAMGWGRNYGLGATVYFGAMGISMDVLQGNHVGAYQGVVLGEEYSSSVDLKTLNIPLMLKVRGESGGYIELGVQMTRVSNAEHSIDYSSSDIFDGTSDVTDKYNKSYNSAILGFGASVKPVPAFPLALNVGVRFQYGFSDAGGVDALGFGLDNSLLYSEPQTTNAISGGIMAGLTFTLENPKKKD